LPRTKEDLRLHYTLSENDLAVIRRKRSPHNRLGFDVTAVLSALSWTGDGFCAAIGRDVSACGTTYLKSRHQIAERQDIDAIYSLIEFGFKLWNWQTARRFVVVRGNRRCRRLRRYS
jgi:hypothetical protein